MSDDTPTAAPTHAADITAVLNDGAADARAVADSDGIDTHGHTPPPAPPSPTVTVTDRWTRRAGERLAAEWRETLSKYTDEHGLVRNHEHPEALDKQCDPNVAADAINTLVSFNPALAETPEDTHRAAWWKQLFASPETQALRARTAGNALAAEMAASELAAAWGDYVIKHPDPKESGKDGGDGLGDGEAGESPADTVARIRSIREAVKKADEAAEMGDAIAGGFGDGGMSGSANAGALAGFARRVRNSKRLADILRMAGRFIAKAQALQRSKATIVGMEATGVELSGDLARALPIEVAQMAGVVEELETLAMVRFVESRLASYKRTKRVPEQLGPIVVSVDESGSMNGPKVVAAKGLALAMASIARAQKRPFLLTSYSGSREFIDGGREAKHTSRTHVATDTPEGIITWCETFLSGGSDLDMPLDCVQTLWPEGAFAKADHIIISDAEIGPVPAGYIDRYKAWAAERNVRTFSIIIGHNRPGPFKNVSDGGIWCLKSLDLDNPAVDTVLAI